jgi:hypothetical protein
LLNVDGRPPWEAVLKI